MLDPITAIGLVAAVGTLAQLSEQVLLGLYKYLVDVKKAPHRSKELREEIGIMLSLVTTLKETMEQESDNIPQASLYAAVEEFACMLREMADQVEAKKTMGARKLVWPFTQAKNAEYLAKIERYKSLFSLALNIDQRFSR
jgi:hypothetical protein